MFPSSETCTEILEQWISHKQYEVTEREIWKVKEGGQRILFFFFLAAINEIMLTKSLSFHFSQIWQTNK